VPYNSVRVPDARRHAARPLPRWGRSVSLGVEFQSICSPIAFPPDAATTEHRNMQGSRAREEGMEPVMELWVDDRILPVRIRMAGRLDASTSPSLLALLDELLAEGVRRFVMDAGELDIGDVWGATALTVFQRRARDAEGSLIWEGFGLGPRNPLARGHTLDTKSDISSRRGDNPAVVPSNVMHSSSETIELLDERLVPMGLAHEYEY
jgi:hypothetical protein